MRIPMDWNNRASKTVEVLEWDAMVADSKFATWEGFGKSQTGHIGLQDHSDKVWYRNIKIREL